MPTKYVSIIPVPPGINGIMKITDTETYLVPAICLALRDDGQPALLVLERWGDIADPCEDENFVGWTYNGETLTSPEVVKFLHENTRLEEEERFYTDLGKAQGNGRQKPSVN